MKRFNFLKKLNVRITLTIIFVSFLTVTLFGIIATTLAERQIRSFVEEKQIELSEIPFFEDQEFRENLDKNVIGRSVNLAAFITIVVSIITGIAISRYILRPFKELTKVIDKLKENDYSKTLSLTKTPEFNVLISKFNELVLKLQSQENLRKNLISDVTHELKTPITSLISQTEAVREGVLEMTPDRLQLFADQLNRLDELVNRLREYTTARSSSINLELEKVYFYEVLESVFDELKEKSKELNIVFHNELPKKFVVDADKNFIFTVFKNIVQNSLLYSNGKNIYVKYQTGNLIFDDDGVGVPDEALKNLFERFFRVEKSRNKEFGGFGLGLSIVREIILSHGWGIEAENISSGGLRITIKLNGF